MGIRQAMAPHLTAFAARVDELWAGREVWLGERCLMSDVIMLAAAKAGDPGLQNQARFTGPGAVQTSGHTGRQDFNTFFCTLGFPLYPLHTRVPSGRCCRARALTPGQPRHEVFTYWPHARVPRAAARWWSGCWRPCARAGRPRAGRPR